jgi:CspA family cold shock protein
MPVKGRVKWFSSQKGYGFIEQVDGGGDVFAHYSEIVGPEDEFRTLEKGAEVEFEVIQGERGPRAGHIVRVAGANPSKAESENPE